METDIPPKNGKLKIIFFWIFLIPLLTCKVKRRMISQKVYRIIPLDGLRRNNMIAEMNINVDESPIPKHYQIRKKLEEVILNHFKIKYI
jgi:hypothetical protein